MTDATKCSGHELRKGRKNKITRALTSPDEEVPDQNLRVLIKTAQMTVETSLKDLEENYKTKKEWKLLEDGGVLSIPVEELRMQNPPCPDNLGNVDFGKKKGERATQIDNYSVVQTIEHLSEKVVIKYNEEQEAAKNEGKSKIQAERQATAKAMKFLALGVQRCRELLWMGG